jgi:hypothetical protein
LSALHANNLLGSEKGTQSSVETLKIAYFSSIESRGSVVGIATGYELDDRGVRIRVPVGSSIFTSPYHSDRPWDLPTHPPIQWVPRAL